MEASAARLPRRRGNKINRLIDWSKLRPEFSGLQRPAVLHRKRRPIIVWATSRAALALEAPRRRQSLEVAFAKWSRLFDIELGRKHGSACAILRSAGGGSPHRAPKAT